MFFLFAFPHREYVLLQSLVQPGSEMPEAKVKLYEPSFFASLRR